MDGQLDYIESGRLRQSRPGGRAEKMVSAIHQATYELLQTTDYEELEIPLIAKLAQVNKTTIYRRWATKTELILDVALARIHDDVPLPNTGNLLSDTVLFLQNIVLAMNTPFVLNILRALLVHHDENILRAKQAFWNERFLLAQPLIDRAIQRGELAETTTVREFFELAAAPLFYRILVIGDSILDQDIKYIVERAILVFKKV